MGFFSVEQSERLAEGTVHVATLVDLEFTGATKRLWNGFGARTFGGETYHGVGDFGSIEGLEEARNPISHQVTFTLSALDKAPVELLSTVLAETDVVQGNLAVVYLQLFDADWQVEGDPIPVYFGIMQPPRVTREPTTEDAGGRRVMVLATENLFFGRSRPAAARYTDREQQTRFPGDRFCEHTPSLVNATIVWPAF